MKYLLRTTYPTDLLTIRLTPVHPREVGKGNGCMFGWGEELSTERCREHSLAELSLDRDSEELEKFRDIVKIIAEGKYETVVEIQDGVGDWHVDPAMPLYYTDDHNH